MRFIVWMFPVVASLQRSLYVMLSLFTPAHWGSGRARLRCHSRKQRQRRLGRCASLSFALFREGFTGLVQNIFVVGSIAELGDWAPASSVRLICCDVKSPVHFVNLHSIDRSPCLRTHILSGLSRLTYLQIPLLSTSIFARKRMVV